MKSVASRGFSLIELAITILLLGIMIGFTIPAFSGFSTAHKLAGATQEISGQIRLAREKAIATGTAQTIRFKANFQDSDYHIWTGAVANPKWKLPSHIRYFWGSGTDSAYTMTKDGRSSNSGMIILQDSRGFRDTVSVQMSGMVFKT